MADEDPQVSRITVSRDALRADLAEVELRLRIYFDEQLRHKADAAPVAELGRALDALDRGDFTPVHRRALIELIQEQTAERQAAGWTSKERALAVMSGAVSVSMLLLSILIALHGASL